MSRKKQSSRLWTITLVATALTCGIIGYCAIVANVQRFTKPAAPWSISTLRVQDDTGHGSGVYIGNGYILTAAHVVGDKTELQIRSERGGFGTAKVLWSNREYDVAMMRSGPLDHVRASKPDCGKPIAIGEAIEAVGNPYDLEFVHTFGRVAGAARKLDTVKTGFLASMLVLPGMSGGPVLRNGRVVGLVNAILQAPVGFGLAAPVPISVIIPISSVCMMLGPNA